MKHPGSDGFKNNGDESGPKIHHRLNSIPKFRDHIVTTRTFNPYHNHMQYVAYAIRTI